MVAFELGLEGWKRAPPERGFGVGVAFLAEPAASKEIWKQGSQACLEKEQVVLTGWSMGSGGVRNMDLLAISAGYGPKGKSCGRRNQNVRTSGF